MQEDQEGAPMVDAPDEDAHAQVWGSYEPDEATGSDEAQPEPDPEPEPEPLPSFDERYREDFEGLMFLGKLEREFRYLGHTFVIRTLLVDEILEIGLLQKRYQGTLGELKAYQAAIAAACVVTIDGQVPPMPITNLPDDNLLAVRFNYVRRHWFPPILDAIYEQYLILETTVDKVMTQMGEALG